MKSKFILVVMLGLLLSLSSCITAKFGNLQYGVDTSDYTVVGELNVRILSLEFLGLAGGRNLFNISASTTERVTRDGIRNEIEAAGGDAARNITLTHKATFGNLLVEWLTFGIIAPSRVIVTGTIIKEQSIQPNSNQTTNINIINQ